jgi:hypothetical protein
MKPPNAKRAPDLGRQGARGANKETDNAPHAATARRADQVTALAHKRRRR